MLPAEAEDQAYRALAHHDRRRLLRVIGEGERSVTDLAERTGLDQPIASQHLRVLRDAHLVTVRVDGNRRLYSIRFDRMQELRSELDAFWSGKLGDLKAAAVRRASR